MMPAETISAASRWLSENGLPGLRMSPQYLTPSFPAGSGPDYVNAAAVVTLRNEMDAAALLALLHKAEAAFGRVRMTRWAGRTLDIDLLAWGDSVLPDAETQTRWRNLPLSEQYRMTPAELILPHPRLQDRAFVLVPLADVAPDWRHPLLGLTVRQMLAALDPADVAAARRL
jgi:2-amino-4-hydroxy-6-hydroxymethyldihydropteridine diphosphokinase